MGLLNNKEVGNRLRFFRENNGFSKRQFAMKAGVDQSQYSKIENGELPITKKILDKLTTTYTMDGDYMLHGMNVPREQDEPPITVANEDHAEYRPEKKIDPLAVINELILQQKTLISNNERLTKTNEDLSQTAIVSLAEILKAFSPSPAKDKKKRHAFDQRASLPVEPVDTPKTHLSGKRGSKKDTVVEKGK